MRVKILSTNPITASRAGTKQPMCAIRTINAVWRMYVLFPAMFGPVISIKSLSSPSDTSFGTNVPGDAASTTGWRP